MVIFSYYHFKECTILVMPSLLLLMLKTFSFSSFFFPSEEIINFINSFRESVSGFFGILNCLSVFYYTGVCSFPSFLRYLDH